MIGRKLFWQKHLSITIESVLFIVFIFVFCITFLGCEAFIFEEDMPIHAASIVYASKDRPAKIIIAASGSYRNGCGGSADLNYRLEGNNIMLSAKQKVSRGVCTQAVIDVYAETEINGLDIGEYVVCYKNCIELIKFRVGHDAIYVKESPMINNVSFVIKNSDGLELQNIEDDLGSRQNYIGANLVVYESYDPVDVAVIAEGHFYGNCIQHLDTHINESKPFAKYVNISGYIPLNDTECCLPKDPRNIFPSVYYEPTPYYRSKIHIGTLSEGQYYIGVNNYGVTLLIDLPSGE